jgi:hypothetical protein
MGLFFSDGTPSRPYPFKIETGSGDELRAIQQWNKKVENILRVQLLSLNDDVVTPFILAVYSCNNIDEFIKRLKDSQINKAQLGTNDVSTKADNAIRYILWLIVNMTQPKPAYILDIFDGKHKEKNATNFLNDLKDPLIQVSASSIEGYLARYLAYYLQEEGVFNLAGQKEVQFRKIDKVCEGNKDLLEKELQFVEMENIEGIREKNEYVKSKAHKEVVGKKFQQALMRGAQIDFESFDKEFEEFLKRKENKQARNEYRQECRSFINNFHSLYTTVQEIAKQEVVEKRFQKALDEGESINYLTFHQQLQKTLNDSEEEKAIFQEEVVSARKSLLSLYHARNIIEQFRENANQKYNNEADPEVKQPGIFIDDPYINTLFLKAKPELKKLYLDYDKLRRKAVDLFLALEKKYDGKVYEQLRQLLESPLNITSISNDIVATLSDRILRLVNVVSQLEDNILASSQKEALEDSSQIEKEEHEEKDKEKGADNDSHSTILDNKEATKNALSTLSVIGQFKKELVPNSLMAVQARAQVRLLEYRTKKGLTRFISGGDNVQDDASQLKLLLVKFGKLDPKSPSYKNELASLLEEFQVLEDKVKLNWVEKNLPHLILRLVGKWEDKINLLLKIRHIKEEAQGLQQKVTAGKAPSSRQGSIQCEDVDGVVPNDNSPKIMGRSRNN